MKKLFLRFNLIVLVLTFSSFSTLKSQTNQYLDFDGINDWVSVPNASSLVTGINTMSITGWFYDNNLNYGQGMMGFRTGTESFYMITLNNGEIECRFINSSNVTAEVKAPASTIIPNIWQHYAWVYDGSAVKLYLNGNLVGSKPASGTLTIGTDIRLPSVKAPWAVLISITVAALTKFQYGIKGLTQAEVQDMIQNELTGTETGLRVIL